MHEEISLASMYTLLNSSLLHEMELNRTVWKEITARGCAESDMFCKMKKTKKLI